MVSRLHKGRHRLHGHLSLSRFKLTGPPTPRDTEAFNTYAVIHDPLGPVYICSLIRINSYEDLQDVVLVGTSAGGMVLCRAAELAWERLARLVFVDALALLPGEQVGSIVQRATPNETTALATGPTKADAEQRLFADLPPALRTWALARYTLHPRAALEAPMELDTFWEQAWDATVICCTRSVNPPEAHQRRTAERLHAAWQALETGHYPMLSAPEALTGLLVA